MDSPVTARQGLAADTARSDVLARDDVHFENFFGAPDVPAARREALYYAVAEADAQVGFVLLDDAPPPTAPAGLRDALYAADARFNPYTTPFVRAMSRAFGAPDAVYLALFRHIFVAHQHLTALVLPAPLGADPAKFLCPLFRPAALDTVAGATVYVLNRVDVLPAVSTRAASVEDFDDLMHLFDKNRADIEARFGELFLSDMVRNQRPGRDTALVAETEEGSTVGFLHATTELDLERVARTFDLRGLLERDAAGRFPCCLAVTAFAMDEAFASAGQELLAAAFAAFPAAQAALLTMPTSARPDMDVLDLFVLVPPLSIAAPREALYFRHRAGFLVPRELRVAPVPRDDETGRAAVYSFIADTLNARLQTPTTGATLAELVGPDDAVLAVRVRGQLVAGGVFSAGLFSAPDTRDAFAELSGAQGPQRPSDVPRVLRARRWFAARFGDAGLADEAGVHYVRWLAVLPIFADALPFVLQAFTTCLGAPCLVLSAGTAWPLEMVDTRAEGAHSSPASALQTDQSALADAGQPSDRSLAALADSTGSLGELSFSPEEEAEEDADELTVVDFQRLTEFHPCACISEFRALLQYSDLLVPDARPPRVLAAEPMPVPLAEPTAATAPELRENVRRLEARYRAKAEREQYELAVANASYEGGLFVLRRHALFSQPARVTDRVVVVGPSEEALHCVLELVRTRGVVFCSLVLLWQDGLDLMARPALDDMLSVWDVDNWLTALQLAFLCTTYNTDAVCSIDAERQLIQMRHYVVPYDHVLLLPNLIDSFAESVRTIVAHTPRTGRRQRRVPDPDARFQALLERGALYDAGEEEEEEEEREEEEEDEDEDGRRKRVRYTIPRPGTAFPGVYGLVVERSKPPKRSQEEEEEEEEEEEGADDASLAREGKRQTNGLSAKDIVKPSSALGTKLLAPFALAQLLCPVNVSGFRHGRRVVVRQTLPSETAAARLLADAGSVTRELAGVLRMLRDDAAGADENAGEYPQVPGYRGIPAAVYARGRICIVGDNVFTPAEGARGFDGVIRGDLALALVEHCLRAGVPPRHVTYVVRSRGEGAGREQDADVVDGILAGGNNVRRPPQAREAQEQAVAPAGHAAVQSPLLAQLAHLGVHIVFAGAEGEQQSVAPGGLITDLETGGLLGVQVAKGPGHVAADDIPIIPVEPRVKDSLQPVHACCLVTTPGPNAGAPALPAALSSLRRSIVYTTLPITQADGTCISTAGSVADGRLGKCVLHTSRRTGIIGNSALLAARDAAPPYRGGYGSATRAERTVSVDPLADLMRLGGFTGDAPAVGATHPLLLPTEINGETAAPVEGGTLAAREFVRAVCGAGAVPLRVAYLAPLVATWKVPFGETIEMRMPHTPPGGAGGRVLVTGSAEAVIACSRRVAEEGCFAPVRPYARLHVNELGVVDALNIFQAVRPPPHVRRVGAPVRYETTAELYPLLPFLKGLIGLPAALLNDVVGRCATGQVPCLVDFLLGPAVAPVLSRPFRRAFAGVLQRAARLPSVAGCADAQAQALVALARQSGTLALARTQGAPVRPDDAAAIADDLRQTWRAFAAEYAVRFPWIDRAQL